MADLVGHLTKFNQNGDYNFLVNDFAPRYYLPILSDPTMDNSDGDAMDDSSDDEPLYHDPDPLSYSNMLSVETIYIPLQKVKSRIGRNLAKKWDCDVYVSVFKSCDCDDDFFIITNEDKSASEVYKLSHELKNKLDNAEAEYNKSKSHVINESAAHAGKVETDDLVPEFFDQGSNFYYGCWIHNYYQEVKMHNYYSEKIDMGAKALFVYVTMLEMYHSVLLKGAYQMQNTEYAEIAKNVYSEEEIQSIMESINGTGFKNHPLRQAYENEVRQLSSYSEELFLQGKSEEEIAQILNETRRNLGIKYKDMTPQPLRDYIYEVNIKRYGDKLGPTYDYLKMAGKTDAEIIASSCRPNNNIDVLLEGFEEWLRKRMLK